MSTLAIEIIKTVLEQKQTTKTGDEVKVPKYDTLTSRTNHMSSKDMKKVANPKKGLDVKNDKKLKVDVGTTRKEKGRDMGGVNIKAQRIKENRGLMWSKELTRPIIKNMNFMLNENGYMAFTKPGSRKNFYKVPFRGNIKVSINKFLTSEEASIDPQASANRLFNMLRTSPKVSKLREVDMTGFRGAASFTPRGGDPGRQTMDLSKRVSPSRRPQPQAGALSTQSQAGIQQPTGSSYKVGEDPTMDEFEDDEFGYDEYEDPDFEFGHDELEDEDYELGAMRSNRLGYSESIEDGIPKPSVKTMKVSKSASVRSKQPDDSPNKGDPGNIKKKEKRSSGNGLLDPVSVKVSGTKKAKGQLAELEKLVGRHLNVNIS